MYIKSENIIIMLGSDVIELLKSNFNIECRNSLF